MRHFYSRTWIFSPSEGVYILNFLYPHGLFFLQEKSEGQKTLQSADVTAAATVFPHCIRLVLPTKSQDGQFTPLFHICLTLLASIYLNTCWNFNFSSDSENEPNESLNCLAAVASSNCICGPKREPNLGSNPAPVWQSLSTLLQK